jgi:hypothetical protein
MQNLPRRSFFVRSKAEGGVIHAYARTIEDPHEFGEITEDELAERVKEMNLGSEHTREREEIEAEWQTRGKKIGLIEKEDKEKDWESFGEPV